MLTGVFKMATVGIKTAFSEMRAHKVRSGLSISGVTMGVASMVVLASLMGGVNAYMEGVMSRWLGAVVFAPRGNATPMEKVSWGRSPGMKLSDGAYLESASSGVKLVYNRIIRSGKVGVGEGWIAANVIGVSEATFAADFRFFRFDAGPGLSPADFESGKPTCLVARDLMDKLLQSRNGRSTATAGTHPAALEFKGRVFSIAGVYEPSDRSKVVNDFKGCVIMPLRTMQKYVAGQDPDPGQLEIAVSDPAGIEARSQEFSKSLAVRHRGIEDFLYQLPQGAQKVHELLENTVLLLGLLAFLSLGMGGFGIMNVMLSSINERTFEIGVRMALGAKKIQIFLQFLVESMTLSIIGGLAGSVLGALPLLFKEEIKESIDGIEPTLMVGHFLVIFLVVVGVGVLFGLHPALKASRLSPIEALRHE